MRKWFDPRRGHARSAVVLLGLALACAVRPAGPVEGQATAGPEVPLVRAPAGFVDVTEYEFMSPNDQEFLGVAFRLLPRTGDGSEPGEAMALRPSDVVAGMRDDLRDGLSAEIAREEDVEVQGLPMRRMDFVLPGRDTYGRLLVGQIDEDRHVHVFHMVTGGDADWSRHDEVQSSFRFRGAGAGAGAGSGLAGSVVHDLGPVSVRVPAGLIASMVFEFHRIEDDIDLFVDATNSEPDIGAWLESVSRQGELEGLDRGTRDGPAGPVERVQATVADRRYPTPRSLCLASAPSPAGGVVMVLAYGPDSAADRVHRGCDDVVAQLEAGR